MHHVQCDGGRKRPVGQTVRHGDGSGGKQRKKQSKSVFLLQRGIHVLIFRILTACLNARVPHMTSEKSSSVFLLLFIKRDRPEVT